MRWFKKKWGKREYQVAIIGKKVSFWIVLFFAIHKWYWIFIYTSQHTCMCVHKLNFDKEMAVPNITFYHSN